MCPGAQLQINQRIDVLIGSLKNIAGTPIDTQFLINQAANGNQQGQSYSNTFKIQNESYYKLVIQPLRRRHRTIGTALRLMDTTSQNRTIEALRQKNEALNEANQRLEERARLIRELTINKIRGFAAREVHDILGHSVVLVISLLEVGLLSIDTETDDVNHKINQAITILKGSLQELENIITAQNPSACERNNRNHNLLNALTMMVKEAKTTGREIELTIQGVINELSALYVDNTFRLCQEAITNAIKHGNASKIYIILRFSTSGYEIYILDNGVGCENIMKGYGISGMEERVCRLNGQIKYGSNENAGFTIHITIPLQLPMMSANALSS